MYILKKIFLILIFFFLNITFSNSSEKIAFIDIDYVLNNSNLGKIIFEELEDVNKKNINFLSKKEGHKLEVSEGVENSLLIFDSKLSHSVPCHLPDERYSITFDLIKQ